MNVNVIVGNNIDTIYWIEKLKLNKAENIYILDYDHFESPKLVDEVVYISALDFKKQIGYFEKINYYKSMYRYPRIDRNRSTR